MTNKKTYYWYAGNGVMSLNDLVEYIRINCPYVNTTVTGACWYGGIAPFELFIYAGRGAMSMHMINPSGGYIYVYNDGTGSGNHIYEYSMNKLNSLFYGDSSAVCYSGYTVTNTNCSLHGSMYTVNFNVEIPSIAGVAVGYFHIAYTPYTPIPGIYTTAVMSCGSVFRVTRAIINTDNKIYVYITQEIKDVAASIGQTVIFNINASYTVSL